MTPKKRKVTLQHVADAAGVSSATVDRVLNRRLPVHEDTALRVIAAAEALGYHAAQLMRQRLDRGDKSRRLGFCLQKAGSPFYQSLAQALREAMRRQTDGHGSVVIEFIDELEPRAIAAQLLDLGRRCDALAVVALDHPHVSAAVAQLHEQGCPCLALLSDLSAPQRLGCVGIDNRQRGRVAAWAVRRLLRAGPCAGPEAGHGAGEVGVFIGSHRYLGQEMSEMAFRAALREQAPGLRVLDAQVNLEDEQLGYEATLSLMARHPQLVGLYDTGGGATRGIVRALREEGAGRGIVMVAHGLTPEHREALIDGVIDLVIETPIRSVADTAVSVLLRALEPGQPVAFGQPFVLPFELYTPENV